MSTAAAAIRVPAGLRARIGDPVADLERSVAFQNRYATPGRVMSVEIARRFTEGNPEPNALRLIVEDERGQVAAIAQCSDGGVHGATPDRIWRGSVRVAPEHQRKGVASALLERLEAHAREKGAAALRGSIQGNEPHGVAFAEKHGYAEYHRRIDSYIDVPSFDAKRFDDPDEMARRADVRLATWTEVAREAGDRIERYERELYDVLNETLKDVPRPEPMAPPPPFEVARKMYFDPPSFDVDSTVVALRGEHPVAVTITLLNPAGVAYTAMTGTKRDERGKGIATALKLRALRVLREKGVRLFGTTNDPANAAMRGINAKLGYVPEPPSINVEKRFR